MVLYAIWKLDNSCILDLNASTTDILDSKTLDQNYNLMVLPVVSGNAEVTKVKVTWNINDINATRMDKKVWDTTELKWVDVAGSPAVMNNGTASFKFENYSSVKVNAAVYFEALAGFNPTVAYSSAGGKITLDTANGNESYSKTNVPTGTVSATVTPGASDFKGKSATTSATKYGTYTVTLSSAKTAQATVGTIIRQNENISLSVAKTLSSDAAAMTEVEIPANTQNFGAGKTAELTVETTAVAEAMANANFNISENENAVSAITLSVKVNNAEVHDFKDASGDPVEVTVTTYIAKGFTNISMKYVGTGDDPTIVSYDSATGKLVFKTTHFSTFAIGADENAYIKETNTASMLADALAALSAGQTLVVLKDIADCPALSVEKNTAGTYTIDFGSHEITFAETTVKDAMAVVIEGEGAFVLKNGTLTCTDYHYGDVFDIWSETTLDHLTVNFTDEAQSGYARWGALYLGAETTFKYCTINAAKGPGIQNGEEGNIVYINNSTITSGDHSALYCGGGSTTYVNNCTASGVRAIHGCTSGAAYIINGGTYTGSEKAIQLDNTTSAIDYQGIPNYVGGSYASVKGGNFIGTLKLNTANEGNAALEISGGTFTANPTAYLKTGYKSTENAGVWTVTETAAD